jgi:PAS domain S-box-containing protein
LIISEAYKNAVLDTALDSIITIDSSGNIISYNKQTTIIFGTAFTNLPAANIDQLVPQLTETLNSIMDNQLHEFKANRADGEVFPLELNVAKMAQDGELRYVIVSRDITERRRLEVLKNEFISVVSHELRTPLTSIRGSLSVLHSGELEQYNATTQKFIEIASQNCDRLLFLINDILDIEKIEAGKMDFNMERVDFDKIIYESIVNNKPYADKYNVKIKLGKHVSGAIVYGDANRLMQVMNNLISNAAKFTEPNTEVELSSEIVGDKLKVSVTDHGKGISEQFQSRIFQKFSQADSPDTRSRGGSGLGLSITKAIVEKHLGNISYTTKEGEGTTFFFTIPLAEIPVIS